MDKRNLIIGKIDNVHTAFYTKNSLKIPTRALQLLWSARISSSNDDKELLALTSRTFIFNSDWIVKSTSSTRDFGYISVTNSILDFISYILHRFYA